MAPGSPADANPNPALESFITTMAKAIISKAGPVTPQAEAVLESLMPAMGKAVMSQLPQAVADNLNAGDLSNLASLVSVVDTPLCIAAHTGKLETVQRLLDEGTFVDEKGEGEGTALFYAASTGHCEIARTLLCAGADMEAPGVQGLTPIMMASGNPELLRDFLDAGANVDAQAGGLTVLCLAAAKGELASVQLLLEAGAGVDIAPAGPTPLTASAQQGNNVEVCELYTLKYVNYTPSY